MDKLVYIEGVILTPEKIISNRRGDIYHAIKIYSKGYQGFGEVYFSFITKNSIKAWKKHIRMTLNLVVPVGKIKFVLFDDRIGSTTYGSTEELSLGPDNYCRLTIPHGIWYGFQGLDSDINLLCNVANMVHDDAECQSMELSNHIIPYSW